MRTSQDRSTWSCDRTAAARGGDVRTLAASGERLYRGEHISLQVTNNSDRDLYVGLFDIDTAYAITLLSSDEPKGWRIPPGESRTPGGPDGIPLEWDPGVPDDAERPETVARHRRHPTATVRRADDRWGDPR